MNKMDFLFAALLIGLTGLMNSCQGEQNDTHRDATGLPYIGQHDVVYQDTGDYHAGDTMFHTVPDFEYLMHDSTYLSTSDIDDKVWIAKFFFTHCPTICPPMTASMKKVNKSLNDYSDEVVFLSFSIDPDRDDPSRLRTYMERHDIRADNWYFLTGDETATHRLGVEGFQLLATADKDAPGGFAHSPNFVLVDEQQHIRGVYDGLDPESRKTLIEDAKKLLSHE
ncbi:MAG: SCO family protein [Bacteroidota bacterium]